MRNRWRLTLQAGLSAAAADIAMPPAPKHTPDPDPSKPVVEQWDPSNSGRFGKKKRK